VSDRLFSWLRIGLLALAVVGLLLTRSLVRMHMGMPVAAFLERLCGGPVDCHHVLQSRWANVRLGPLYVSTSVLGMGYFTVLGIWLLAVGRLRGRWHHFWAVPALAGTAGAAFSAFLIYVMGSKLEAWCGACLATHIVNFPLVAGLWWVWLKGASAAEPEPSVAPSAESWKVPVLALAAGLALAVAQDRQFRTGKAIQTADAVFRRFLQTEGDIQANEQYQRWRFRYGPAAAIPVRDDDPVLGPADAPHTVVIFSDFQCRACAATEAILRKVQEALAGQFRIVFKHYPLNSVCNRYRLPAQPTHSYACEAAAAAEAARRLGGSEAFWKMHDAIFANQSRLAERPYTELAKQIGLDPVAFERLWKDPATMDRVRRDAELAGRLQVIATPKVFLDGREIRRPVAWTYQQNRFDRTETIRRTIRLWRKLLEWAGQAPATAPAAAASQPSGSR